MRKTSYGAGVSCDTELLVFVLLPLLGQPEETVWVNAREIVAMEDHGDGITWVYTHHKVFIVEISRPDILKKINEAGA